MRRVLLIALFFVAPSFIGAKECHEQFAALPALVKMRTGYYVFSGGKNLDFVPRKSDRNNIQVRALNDASHRAILRRQLGEERFAQIEAAVDPAAALKKALRENARQEQARDMTAELADLRSELDQYENTYLPLELISKVYSYFRGIQRSFETTEEAVKFFVKQEWVARRMREGRQYFLIRYVEYSIPEKAHTEGDEDRVFSPLRIYGETQGDLHGLVQAYAEEAVNQNSEFTSFCPDSGSVAFHIDVASGKVRYVEGDFHGNFRKQSDIEGLFLRNPSDVHGFSLGDNL